MAVCNDAGHLHGRQLKLSDVSSDAVVLHCLGSLVRSETQPLLCSNVDQFSIVDRGIIGPARQFGPGSVYHSCLYAFIAGGILPIALWLYLRRVSLQASLTACFQRSSADTSCCSAYQQWPNSWTKDINIPVALNGPLNIPAVPALNTAVWVIVSFLTREFCAPRPHFYPLRTSLVFSSLCRIRLASTSLPFMVEGSHKLFACEAVVHFNSPSSPVIFYQFNYILSVGLDTGTVIGVLIIFLCLQLPKAGTLSLSWWGNLVYTQSLSLFFLSDSYLTGFAPTDFSLLWSCSSGRARRHFANTTGDRLWPVDSTLPPPLCLPTGASAADLVAPLLSAFFSQWRV